MYISAVICQQLFSRFLRKLWNVSVGRHDCNSSMHLLIFNVVDARSLKEDQYCTLWHNLDHRQHRSPPPPKKKSALAIPAQF